MDIFHVFEIAQMVPNALKQCPQTFFSYFYYWFWASILKPNRAMSNSFMLRDHHQTSLSIFGEFEWINQRFSSLLLKEFELIN